MVNSKELSVAVVTVAEVVLAEVVVEGLTITLRARKFVNPITPFGLDLVVRMSTTTTEDVDMSISAPLALRRLVTRRATRLTTAKVRASPALLLLGLVL